MNKQDSKNLVEKLPRRPGQSSEEKLGILKERLLLWVVIIASSIGVIILEWIIAIVKIQLEPRFLVSPTIAVVILVLFSLWKITQIKSEMEHYRLGQVGERAVAQTLENLIRSTGCYVYHAVVFKRDGKIFDIDHIMVSTLGIFIIETKTRSKKSTSDKIEYFDGKIIKLTNQPPDPEPVNQVRRNIKTMKEELEKAGITGKALDITGIVVYPGWFFDKDKMDTSSKIWVSNAKYLEFAVPKLKPVFTNAEIETLSRKIEEITEIKTQLKQEI